jgi:N-acetyl-alpha-D-muramate 1-phosphate uridylyltransferase
MNVMPKTAMVLAAGLGLRMRAVSATLPKPLIAVGGKALIDRTLDRLRDSSVERAVVNLHYKGSAIRSHLATRKSPAIIFSDESDRLLETGGGVAKALPQLGAEAFFVVNSDIIWRDAQGDSLAGLARRFDEAAMDALLLLQPTVGAIGYSGAGDFHLCPEGQVQRRDEREVAPFVFTGVQILHPRLFANCPPGAFSLNLLYDRAIAAGRLYGLRHQGDWMDVGTPDGLKAAEAALGG